METKISEDLIQLEPPTISISALEEELAEKEKVMEDNFSVFQQQTDYLRKKKEVDDLRARIEKYKTTKVGNEIV